MGLSPPEHPLNCGVSMAENETASKTTTISSQGHHAERDEVPGLMEIRAFDLRATPRSRLLPKWITHGRVCPVKDAYFLHYQGITTNWKKQTHDRLQEDERASRASVEDLSVIDAFAAMRKHI